MTNVKKTKNIPALFDAIADDVMSLTEEELAQELADEGRSIEDSAASLDTITQRVRDSEGLRRLADARAGYANMVAQRRAKAKRSGDFARRKLEELSKSHGLMRAARNNNGEPLSDHDALQMLEDAEDLLGLQFDEDQES